MMTNPDIDLRLQAVREVTGILDDVAKLAERARAVLIRLVDEMETLADDPEPVTNAYDSYPQEGP